MSFLHLAVSEIHSLSWDSSAPGTRLNFNFGVTEEMCPSWLWSRPLAFWTLETCLTFFFLLNLLCSTWHLTSGLLTCVSLTQCPSQEPGSLIRGDSELPAVICCSSQPWMPSKMPLFFLLYFWAKPVSHVDGLGKTLFCGSVYGAGWQWTCSLAYFLG